MLELITTTWHEYSVPKDDRDKIVFIKGWFGNRVEVARYDSDSESWYNDSGDDITEDVTMWTDIPRV